MRRSLRDSLTGVQKAAVASKSRKTKRGEERGRRRRRRRDEENGRRRGNAGKHARERERQKDNIIDLLLLLELEGGLDIYIEYLG